MFSEKAAGQAVAGLVLVVLGVVGCHERIVVGTEPIEEPSIALPGASDAGPADVAESPDADDIESDEGDEGDQGDDAQDDTAGSQEDDD